MVNISPHCYASTSIANTNLNKKTDKVKEDPTDSYNTIVFDVLYNVLNKC